MLRAGPQRRLRTENLMVLNCGVGEEKTPDSPLDCKESKPVNPKESHPWLFFGKTDTEAPILWPPGVKNWLTGKGPDAGKDWGQEEKGVTKDEMVGWHPRLNGHDFKQTLGDSEGWGSQVCCSPWSRKELDTNEWTRVFIESLRERTRGLA